MTMPVCVDVKYQRLASLNMFSVVFCFLCVFVCLFVWAVLGDLSETLETLRIRKK